MINALTIIALVIGVAVLAALNIHLLHEDIALAPLSAAPVTTQDAGPGALYAIAGALRPKLAGRPIASFPETTSRPLFWQSRRQPEPVAPPVAPVVGKVPAVVEPKTAEFRLAGISSTAESKHKALLVWPLHPAGQWLAKGSEVEGWKVTHIDARAVRLEAGSKTLLLELE